MKKSQAPQHTLRTWIEVDTKALTHNILTFRNLIGPKVKLMAVVKSNAYGHGLVDFTRELTAGPGRSEVDWFGVDAFPEAVRLRKEGIRKPILVLGYTLPTHFREAAKRNISLTISTFENIRALRTLKRQPNIHIKIDTGMHRQGFLPHQIPAVIRELKRAKLYKEVEGLYTHFAAAKDCTYPFYTKEQIRKFEKAYLLFEANGFLPFLRHAAATAGTLLHPEAHYDMVRIGIGLYGLWPSREIMLQYELLRSQMPEARSQMPDARCQMPGARYQVPGARCRVRLEPILSWKAIVSEVKRIPAGSFVGYDLTERVTQPTTIAVIPVGYWHGVDRGLSSIGHVLIRGRRAKIIGRVSMDMIVVDATAIAGVRPGDLAVLIGSQRKEAITAYEWAEKLGTTHYEVLTRINPLIKRIYSIL